MSPIHKSGDEPAMRVVLAFNDAFNRHDVAAMMALMSEDCVFEDTNPAPDGARYVGREALRRHWEAFFRASPRACITIEEIFGAGNRCVMRWRYDWVDAVGAEGHVRGVDIFREHQGLIRAKLSYVKG